MRIGINNNWYIMSNSFYVKLQLGGIGLYLSKVRLRPNGSTQSRMSFRNNLLKRDGYRCKHCGCKLTNATMSIHHIKPKRSFPELKRDPDNCVCLCEKCHSQFHKEDDLEFGRRFKEIRQGFDKMLSVDPSVRGTAIINNNTTT